MFSLLTGGDGLFGVAMGNNSALQDEQKLAAILHMEDCEDALEQLLDRTYHAEPLPGDSGPLLASILNSWRCVRRAREAAGYGR